MNFQLLETSDKILSILKGLSSSKAAGSDILSGKFLKVGAHGLANVSTWIFLLSSIPSQEVAKLLQLNHFLKKVLRPMLKTTTLFHFSPLSSKIIERIGHDQTKEFLSKNKIYY